jgi:hypothetical protein
VNVAFYEITFAAHAMPSEKKSKKLRAVVGVSDDSQVFIDSALLGVPAIMAFACFVGQASPVVHSRGRVFVPCDLLKHEFPSHSQAIQRLSAIAKEIAGARA